jgi:hypothetical protein
MSDALEHLQQGDQYLSATGMLSGRESRFNTELLYDIMFLAAENYLVSILNANGIIPADHTYMQLCSEAESSIDFPLNLKERLLRIERMNDICMVAPGPEFTPTESVIEEFASICFELKSLADTHYAMRYAAHA